MRVVRNENRGLALVCLDGARDLLDFKREAADRMEHDVEPGVLRHALHGGHEVLKMVFTDHGIEEPGFK